MRTGKLSEAHGLTVLTLIVLAAAVLLGRNAVLGSWRHVAASLAFTLVSGPQDPLLQKLVGATFLVFLVGMVLQVRHLRRGRGQIAHPAT